MPVNDTPIRLLIVDQGLHSAEKIVSLLRGTGMQVRAEFAEDDEDIRDLLQNHHFDLVLFCIDSEDFLVQDCCSVLRKNDAPLPVIALTHGDKLDATASLIQNGARDLVSSAQPQHLVLVLKREAQAASLERRLSFYQSAFEESEKRCQGLLMNSLDSVAYVHEGMHIYANKVYLERFGFESYDDIEGTPLMDLVSAEKQAELKQILRDLSQGKLGRGSHEFELPVQPLQGEGKFETIEFSLASYDGEPCTQILIRADNDTSELEETINFLHEHDLTTKLYNRQFFMDSLGKAQNLAVQSSNTCALMEIAIDHQDTLRETLGMTGCDHLLLQIANDLKEIVIEPHLLARFSTWSFAAIVKLAENEKQDLFVNNLLSKCSSKLMEHEGVSVNYSLSIGLTLIDEKSPHNSNELTSRSNKACKAAQEAGGNQYKRFVPVAGERTQGEELNLWAQRFKTALTENHLTALYQPLVSINGKEGERFICSMMMTDENGQMYELEDFSSPAEATGMAKALDRWMIMNALQQASNLRRSGRHLEFFIPLSLDSLRDPNLVHWLADQVTEAALSTEALVLMIDESLVVTHLKEAKILHQNLKDLGMRLMLDQFGTGLQPFELIKHLPVSLIRFHHSYSEHLSSNVDNQDSIRELSEIAREKQIESICQNVDDASVLSIVWGLGVNYVQGDFLQESSPDLRYDFSSISG